MIRRLVLGLFAISGLLRAGAADGHLRNEVFGAVGVGATWHDEGSLGSGLTGGGGFGYRQHNPDS